MEREPGRAPRPNTWAFSVRLLTKRESASRKEGATDLRTEFWNSVIGAEHSKTFDGATYDGLPSPSTIDRAEQELRTNFGEALTHSLREMAGGTHGKPTDRDRPFFVVVDKISYGSLSLDLLLFGVTQFLAAFENDDDMASEALRRSAVSAFGGSLSGVNRGDASRSIERVECNTEMLRGFLPADKQQDAQGHSGRSDHLLRLVANATLLFPVLLALYVCSVAFSAIREQKANLDKQTVELSTLQQSAIQQERSSLEKQHEDVRRAQTEMLIRYAEEVTYWRNAANAQRGEAARVGGNQRRE